MSGVITTCGDRDPIAVLARGKHLVVDIHAHLGIPATAKLVEEQYPGPPPGIGDSRTQRPAKSIERSSPRSAAH